MNCQLSNPATSDCRTAALETLTSQCWALSTGGQVNRTLRLPYSSKVLCSCKLRKDSPPKVRVLEQCGWRARGLHSDRNRPCFPSSVIGPG